MCSSVLLTLSWMPFLAYIKKMLVHLCSSLTSGPFFVAVILQTACQYVQPSVSLHTASLHQEMFYASLCGGPFWGCFFQEDPKGTPAVLRVPTIWLWVNNAYPTWNPDKWNQSLKPAVQFLWWFLVLTHPHLLKQFCTLREQFVQRNEPGFGAGRRHCRGGS